MIHSAVPDVISIHDPNMNPNGVDEDVIGAAQVLFGHSFMNFRNLAFAAFPTQTGIDDMPQASNTSESTTSQPSSPEDLNSENEFHDQYDDDAYYTPGRIFSVSVSSSNIRNKRKRKAPKRYEDTKNETEISRSPRIKAAKIQKSKEPKIKQEQRNGKRVSESQSPDRSYADDDNALEQEAVSKFPNVASGSNLYGVIIPHVKPVTTKKSSRRCDYCSATTTPMWRHGPVGYNDLCNKCGVKWMRGRILPGLTR